MGLISCAVPIFGANGMDDIFRWEIITLGKSSFTGGAAAQFLTFLLKC